MCSAGGDPVLRDRIAPFGYPRINLLDSNPRLIAVLPRPSSALDAMAFTMCSYCLTCFRLGISQLLLSIQYQVPSNSKLETLFLHCNIQLLRFILGIKKAAGDLHQAACLAISPLALPYVTVLLISNIVNSNTSLKALSIWILVYFLWICSGSFSYVYHYMVFLNKCKTRFLQFVHKQYGWSNIPFFATIS